MVLRDWVQYNTKVSRPKSNYKIRLLFHRQHFDFSIFTHIYFKLPLVSHYHYHHYLRQDVLRSVAYPEF